MTGRRSDMSAAADFMRVEHEYKLLWSGGLKREAGKTDFFSRSTTTVATRREEGNGWLGIPQAEPGAGPSEMYITC